MNYFIVIWLTVIAITTLYRDMDWISLVIGLFFIVYAFL